MFFKNILKKYYNINKNIKYIKNINWMLRIVLKIHLLPTYRLSNFVWIIKMDKMGILRVIYDVMEQKNKSRLFH